MGSSRCVRDGTDTCLGWAVADVQLANARRESELIEERVRSILSEM
jgi:hypothetical protein